MALKIYNPPVPLADEVSRACTLLRYMTCSEAETDCLQVTVMRVIFTSTLLMSRNWSPGLWSRYTNSLQRFTAHSVLTEIIHGQHDHTWSALGSYNTHYTPQSTVFIPLHLYTNSLYAALMLNAMIPLKTLIVHTVKQSFIVSVLLPVCVILVGNW